MLSGALTIFCRIRSAAARVRSGCAAARPAAGAGMRVECNWGPSNRALPANRRVPPPGPKSGAPAGSGWRGSRYAHLRFRSPRKSDWSAFGAFTYTNTPSISGTPRSGYSYGQLTLGVSKRF